MRPLAFVLLTASVVAQDPGTNYRFRVDLRSHPRALALIANLDVLGACSHGLEHLRGANTCEVIVPPGELAAFRRLALRSTLVDRGRPYAAIARSNSPQAPDTNYFTVPEIEAELLKLQTTYPLLARRVDITALTNTSKTHRGHSMFAIVISDNIAKSEDEPCTLVASQHHARELNSPYMSIQIARRLLAGYATNAAIKKIIDENEIWIVPCMNPDGVSYVWSNDNYWRKNRRDNGGGIFGVDLNRNYPFRWGVCGSSTNRSSNNYRGPSAGSEPETKTIMALAQLKRFEKYLDFHSSGQEVLHTYSPCTTPGAGTKAVIEYWRGKLAAKMSYRVRNPSASGEAPEWHWYENGSLSYLIEVGTSFQPSFSVTVAEEKRVWPGALEFLGWGPSFRGHVRSLKDSTPLSAVLDAASLGSSLGERSRSDAARGRLHLWMPPGTSALTTKATGHDSATGNVTAPAYGTTRQLDRTLVPNLPATTLTAPSTLKIGKPATLVFRTGDPAKAYWIPMAFGSSPGLSIPPRTLPINPDPLFFLSMGSLAPIYSGHIGTLDTRGEASARFTPPNSAAFIGFRFWFTGMTFETGWPLGIKAFSNAHSITLTR